MRLKSPNKKLDWSVLINQLQTDTKCSLTDIATASGFNSTTICKVKSERGELPHADETLELLMLFFLNTDRDIPILGEHYEQQTINQ
jgi:hypothetical protein